MKLRSGRKTRSGSSTETPSYENGAPFSNHIRKSIVLNNDHRFKNYYQTVQKLIRVKILKQEPTRVVNLLPP